MKGGIFVSEQRYPLTHPQKRIWETEKFVQNSSISNLVGSIKIRGLLDIHKIKQAIELFIQKNDSIRLRIVEEDNGVKQYIAPYKERNIPVVNLREVNKTFEEWVEEETSKPFTLLDSDLFQFVIFRNGNNESGVLTKIHHIISDAWSIHYMANRIMGIYGELCNGSEVSTSQDHSYLDYIVREEKYKQSKRFERNEKFWLDEFQDMPTSIGIKESNIPFRSTNAKRKTFTLSSKMTSDIYRFCKDNQLSVFTLFMSILSIYLRRMTDRHQFVLGTTILNRFNLKERQTFGMFTSTMPFKVELDDEFSVIDFLEIMSRKQMALFRNQQYPFDLLTRKLRNSFNYVNRLFDVALSYQNSKLEINKEKALQEDYETKWHFSGHELNSLSIHINDREEKNELMLDFDYLTDLFSEAEINTHFNRMCQIIICVMESADKKISDLEIIPTEEKHQLVTGFAGEKTTYDRTKTIHQIFEEQVLKTPENTAIIFGEQRCTYMELNRSANQLARIIKQHGVESLTPVGVIMDRSVEMFMAIIAIIKAGGIYVPIDPHYPEGRVNYMIDNSEIKLLLTMKDTYNAPSKVPKLYLDSLDLNQEIGENLSTTVNPTNPIYIMYTSGSTGRPKGIRINQQSLHNFIHGFIRAVDFSKDYKILSLTSMSFDPFVVESFLPLSMGMTVILANEEQRQNPSKIKELILQHEIDVIQLTPSRLKLLLLDENAAFMKQLQMILVGGESLTKSLVKKVKERSEAKLYNIYGPTETTVWLTSKEIDSADELITVGKPIANKEIYILNKKEKLQPIGVVGELCISGEGIAEGYLSNKELSAEKFVKNPFNPNQIMYKSGDLARWLPNGELELIGREDDQVKINGVRVELGEIQNQLMSYPKIIEAFVSVKKNNNEKYLCAYFTSKENISIGELREHLTYHLPNSMIPSYFFPLQEIPLTPNGKVDQKKLPVPSKRDEQGNNYVAPRSDLERNIVKIWAQLFNKNKRTIGINDNFIDLGGHSLIAIEFVSRIQKELGVELYIKDIFQHTTIERLAAHIETLVKKSRSKITPVPHQHYYPISTAQKRLFIINQTSNSTNYNMPGVFELKGNWDSKQLEVIFQKIIERHESYRTSFKIVNGVPVQEVQSKVDFRIQHVQLRDRDPMELVHSLIQPFDLSHPPLLRVYLIHVQEGKFMLFVDMHHIISDGTSIKTLMEDFIAFYKGDTLTPLEVQYKDFTKWQEEHLLSEEMKKQEEYWLEVFSTEVPDINIPLDRARPSITNFKGDNLKFTIEGETLAKLKQVARRNEVTLFMVLFSVYNILLSKYSNKEDITVGVPIIGRKNDEIKNIIGMFVNTLAIRNYPQSTLSFSDFLGQVKENLLKAYEHQEYPFEKLIDLLNLPFDRSKSPLFQTMFVMQGTPFDSFQVGGLEVLPVEVDQQDIKFDLTFEIKEKEALEVKINYSTALFNLDTIQRMAGYFKELIHQITDNNSILLQDIQLLSEAEQRLQIYQWNDTKEAINTSKIYQERFEEQVEQTPNRIAVFTNDGSLTYNELNQKANQVAHLLREKGVKPETIVGIMLHRSTEMIIGILGILKAGAAYLPVNPSLPIERINYMIQDSQVKILLTNVPIHSEIQFSGLTVQVNARIIAEQDTNNPAHITKPNDLTYVIYTSGSTGNPKGVMIEHHSLINRLEWMQNNYPLTESDIIMQKTPYTFDVSVWEILWWSMYGATVYLLPPDGEKEPALIAKAIEEHKVSVMHFVPSMFTIFLEHLKQGYAYDLSSLRQIFTSGEALLSSHVVDFHERISKHFNTRLTNLYGPTEATIDVSYFDCDEPIVSSTIPIGKPIANTSLYILNKQYQIQPIGVDGELYIGGIGLARGYLNRHELTESKFIDNPFIPGTKMYQTGDVARYLPDGNIEYIGRTDDQVKIRGNRVELGEVETKLMSHDSITDAVIIAVKEENGNYDLCAYYVADDPIPNLELRNFLSSKLPDYMLPTMYVCLDSIPLNPSGKVDRKALRNRKDITKSKEYLAPSNEIEERLTKVWAEFLAMEEQSIGMMDSFFELGGHSLKAVSIISKIYEEFGVQLSLKDIFQSPTIRELTQLILSQNKQQGNYSKIETVSLRKHYPLTPSQKRLYLLEQVNKMDTSYHLSEALLIRGSIDKERLRNSFQKLVKRHESLRTSFSYQKGEIVQIIHNDLRVEIMEDEAIDKDLDQLINQFITTFDLTKAPLLRMKLVKLKEKKHLLLFDLHHIIADGVSIDILIRDFVAFYQDEPLPSLGIQYRDYAVWKINQIHTENLKKQVMYWRDVFYRPVQPLKLPYDLERPNHLTIDGGKLSIELDKKTTYLLRSLTKKEDKTLYTILFSIYNVLLSKYSGQADLVVGTPIAGRQHPDVQNLIGMFVNTLAIRSYLKEEKSFMEYVETLNETILEAYEHQDYPLEELLNDLQLERFENQHPLFNTMFDMKVSNHEIHIQGLQIEKYPMKRGTAKFDLSLEVEDVGESLILHFEYNTHLFRNESIERIADDFLNILEKVVENPYVLLAEIQLKKRVKELKPMDMGGVLLNFNKE